MFIISVTTNMQVKSQATGKVVVDTVHRVAQAIQAYNRKKNFFTPNTALSLDTEKLLIKSFAWSVCGTKTWTIPKAEKAKIEAIEVWCWRRTIKVP